MYVGTWVHMHLCAGVKTQLCTYMYVHVHVPVPVHVHACTCRQQL